MGLDSFLPDYFLREIHHLAVRTSPSETYRNFCDFDMSSIPWIRTLFRIRTALDRNKPDSFHLTLRDAYRNGGFVLLEEQPDQELVVGAIGKIWRPAIAFKKIDSQNYANFHLAGFGKVAWSLRCDPRIGGGTLCSFEVRVGATDSISAAKMRGYYSLIGPFSRAIRRTVNKVLEKRLDSACADESTRALPGDSLIENPENCFTHAITIEAPPEAIWPWLAQMGCLRGGWYSYDWLDNAGVSSASQIIPEWQNIQAGDFLNWTPQGDASCFVVAADPMKALVLGSCYDFDLKKSVRPDAVDLPATFLRSTWTFVLEPQTTSVTRLIVRVRGGYRLPKEIAPHLRILFIRPVHAFMERKQLQNLKMRAESLAEINLSKDVNRKEPVICGGL